MNFAVIKTGGKQYKVSEGMILKIEKLAGNWAKGDAVVFDDVLLLDNGATIVGTPNIAGKKIEATFVEHGREKTIDVIKYRAKSNYFKKRGHRQPFVKIKIGAIA